MKENVNCVSQEVNVPGGNVSNFPMDFLADRFLSAVLEICPDAHAGGNGAEENADNNTDREKAKNYEMCYGHNKIRDMYCHNCNQVSVYNPDYSLNSSTPDIP